jgi:hypothetical protein
MTVAPGRGAIGGGGGMLAAGATGFGRAAALFAE